MSSLGVLVMRVQVDDLHEGHYDVIKEVVDNNDKTLIVIGLSPCKCTENNPLDYDTRRRMVLDHFPSVMIGYIEDVYDDKIWSSKLDRIIGSKVKAGDTICLYGSRDSFIKHYHGIYDTESIDQRVHISGTQIRKGLALRSRNTRDFRAGAIWYAMNQYPTAIPTVDIAVVDINDDILLGRKPGEDKYRLVGGFVQPGECYEDAAKRELQEETGVIADEVIPMKSFFIDDWRYKGEVNKITSFLYVVENYEGRIKPDDDIEELAWFSMHDDDLLDSIVPVHHEMINYLIRQMTVGE
ncbi:MAG: NUDIX domain-containing protein [Candidatus Peribacteraceae bacterium]|nr:NUDIX domain-containing protein [Candidatus Peribacteraceae bacterium]